MKTIPKKDGTGPSKYSTGPRDGKGQGKGMGGAGVGKKTGGKKGSC